MISVEELGIFNVTFPFTKNIQGWIFFLLLQQVVTVFFVSFKELPLDGPLLPQMSLTELFFGVFCFLL